MKSRSVTRWAAALTFVFAIVAIMSAADDKPAPKADDKPAPKADDKPAPKAGEKPAPKTDKPAAKAPEKPSKKKPPEPEVPFEAPTLPEGKEVVTDSSDKFLKPPQNILEEIEIAKTPPTVDFLFYPGQTYDGNPWSNWGDSVFANGKYYAAIGDHLAPEGNAFVFEYDPEKKTVRQLLDLRSVLNLPKGHYTPGKIHGRLDMGDDGWLYFSTHRGSASATTTDKFHYQGDWILRCNPATGEKEVVVHAPVPKACIPNSVLDPKRLIFYGATAEGAGKQTVVQFFAYDLKEKKVLYVGPKGPARYFAFAKSTGRIYYVPGDGKEGTLMRYDPEKPTEPPVAIKGKLGMRTASQETPQGLIYTISHVDVGAKLFSINTKTEEIEVLGSTAIAKDVEKNEEKPGYITSLDADPTGRYLYYTEGAHGGCHRSGSAVVQYDLKTKKKKVLAFLHPYYKQKYGVAPAGSYSSALDSKGENLYITWNLSRGGKVWDFCGLTVVHIPESERQP